MVQGPEVAIAITADSKGVTAEIARVTQEVNAMGKSLDGTNDIAVRTFRNASASAKEYLTAVGATAAQHEKLAAVTVASTRNMSALSAMEAEATGHVGEHSLSLGRLAYRMETATAEATGLNRVVGLLGASFLKFGVGDIYSMAIIGGIYAVVKAYDALTAGARDAKAANDKALESLLHWAEPTVGPKSERAKGYVELLKQRAEVSRHLQMLMSAHNDTEVATAFLGAGEAVPFLTRDKEIDRLTAKLAKLNEEFGNVQKKGAEGGKLKDVTIHSDAKKDNAEANRLFLAELHEAERIGNAAERSVMRMLAANERMRNEIGTMRIGTLESNASHEDVTSVKGGMDALEVIKAKREQERRRIEESGASRDVQFEAQQAADERELAEIKGLNNRIEAETERHQRKMETAAEKDASKQVQIVKHRADMIYAAEMGVTNGMLSGKRNFGRELLKVTLEPEIRLMEALAAKQFALAAGDFADHNWASAIHHLKAGATFAAEGGVIAGIANGGGGSGGGGGGGGGGSAGMGAQFGTQRGQSDQPLKLEILVVHQDMNGREIARINQTIDRMNSLNYPVKIGGLG